MKATDARPKFPQRPRHRLGQPAQPQPAVRQQQSDDDTAVDQRARRRAELRMTLNLEREGERPKRVQVAAVLLIAALVAGPFTTHVYWLFGGTWGLYTNGVADEVASTGVRVVAGVVCALLITAMLVVVARVGWWQQRVVSDRVIRLLAWALAAVFLLETLAAFTWSRGEPDWLLYGPVSFVIATLALIVAAPARAARPDHRTHGTLASNRKETFR